MNEQGSPIFVGAAVTGTGLRLARFAHERGYAPHVVVERQLISAARAEDRAFLNRLQERRQLHLVESLDSLTADEINLERLAKCGGIVCPADRYLLASARIAEALGIPYLPEAAARILRDKRLLRTKLAELDLASPPWAHARDVDDVLAFCRSVDGPWIVKNVMGTGSQDTVLATVESDAAEAVRAMTSRSRYMDADLMIESFVDAPVVSLEGFVVDDRLTTLGLTDRAFGPRPYFAETGWGFPVDDTELQESTAAIARIVLAALGVKRSAFHFEFLVHDDQPILMDANCRLPGAMIMPLLHHLSAGTYYTFLLDSVLGRWAPVPTFHDYGAIVKRYADVDGTLRRAAGVADAATYPGVLEVVPQAEVGSRVRRARDYLGALHWVLARGDSLDIAKRRARIASDHIMAGVNVEVADE
ncbi:ATP-grasp domain-containing protein [Streptomyces demainii]|uniref:Biotin carboxylase n=1 Tax=Streptomyces demainii TaxID=588122 RepID=A0ABT9KXS9_9ACTN|nr:hypothetical protein [Streptomyces demainii]MDP9612935.1 biotin carboxylase [Streptomyces demainii]